MGVNDQDLDRIILRAFRGVVKRAVARATAKRSRPKFPVYTAPIQSLPLPRENKSYESQVLVAKSLKTRVATRAKETHESQSTVVRDIFANAVMTALKSLPQRTLPEPPAEWKTEEQVVLSYVLPGLLYQVILTIVERMGVTQREWMQMQIHEALVAASGLEPEQRRV
jgi:hypothetical protein